MVDAGKILLRLTIGILMLFHGVNKLRHGIAFIEGVVTAHHWPSWIAYGVFVGELIAPILLIIGLLTRPAALVVAFDMLVAMYLVLGASAFTLARQTGALNCELQLLYLGGSLAIAFLGSGRFAISRGRGRWD
ncbi:MAG TPA: DoxX family protein [Thermoanaerobaculia bacterium]|nr:DoxX family protein [Thermoanaerobaculia bacterium]